MKGEFEDEYHCGRLNENDPPQAQIFVSLLVEC